jgi:arylsulfatase A-like enzyme
MPARAPAALLLLAALAGLAAAERPNVVIILADDLGYGDVRCLNPDGKIATPHLDRLAAEGMRFTDAHAGSAVCTPTRYGLLTGRYAWRSRLKSGVLGGMSPPLIEEGRQTLAHLFARQGYATACIGKWHLGMSWARKPGTSAFDDRIEKGADGWNADFARPIARGPTSVGFARYFGISASLDMVPYAFIEGDRVTAQPDTDLAFAMVADEDATGPTTRRGPGVTGFAADAVLATLTRAASGWIAEQAAAKQPFFLYLPLASPHTPVAPSAAWRGKSGISPYADFVMESDAAVGEVLAALERAGVARDTLVVFTSDNGFAPAANLPAQLAKGHNPCFRFRGTKADLFEGGHRVPFLVRWPGVVAPGSTSARVIGLLDVMATCAGITGAALDDATAEDSVSFLPALRGDDATGARAELVHHSINGSFAIRAGRWKLLLAADSGGWSAPRPGSPAAKGLPPLQLYDLDADLGETANVQAQHPDVVRDLLARLGRLVSAGRSTPGAPQANLGTVDIWRGQPPAAP